MDRSDAIKGIEKHQKKSLKQIRELMLHIVRQRKMRN